MGQAAALSGLIVLTGPLAIVLKPPPVTWLGLISANIGYFISAPFLSSYQPSAYLPHNNSLNTCKNETNCVLIDCGDRGTPPSIAMGPSCNFRSPDLAP